MFVRAKGKLIGLGYRKAIKPVLFLSDAERVHNGFTLAGESLGRFEITRRATRALFYYHNKKLEQNILGIKFPNPVGLAAGFDYEARLTQILPDVGFGFQSVGSVTYGFYEGNPKPRLGRLPKSKSLLVNKGLKSNGSGRVIYDLRGMKFRIPLGISVAKTNCTATAEIEAGAGDYVSSLILWEQSGIGDYYELNISCPNAFGGEPFTTPARLELLLAKIDKLKSGRPMFLKMPVELSERLTDGLCRVAARHRVEGLIFGNLVKDRRNEALDREELKNAGLGNFSGMPTREPSNRLIGYAYKKYKDRFVIIGCGGVFGAEDAYEKIRLGASLVQMITGMVFEGPQVIGEINRGLTQLLERDGFKNISEAVGSGLS